MAAWANTALVGRLPELKRLEEEVREAAAGRGGTVLMAGDAGIGKTRLVTELGARAPAAGAQLLVGRCIDLVGADVPAGRRGDSSAAGPRGRPQAAGVGP